jgi:hypothetical protein
VQTLQLRPFGRHTRAETCAGAGGRVAAGHPGLPQGHPSPAPRGGSRRPLGRFAAALLAATVMLGALWLGHPQAAPAANASLSELGDRVCAPHGARCRELWNARMAAGDNFNTLVAAVCHYLRYEVYELDGINCVETVIQAARAQPTILNFPGTSEGARHTREGGRPPELDPQWLADVSAYLAGIPSYCDQTTPVIYDYFDCVLRELQTYEFALRHRHL